jgi:hypothetical protein
MRILTVYLGVLVFAVALLMFLRKPSSVLRAVIFLLLGIAFVTDGGRRLLRGEEPQSEEYGLREYFGFVCVITATVSAIAYTVIIW